MNKSTYLAPQAMKGDGYYNAHCEVQRSAVNETLPLVANAVNHSPLPIAGHPFAIVDYGSGEGANSVVVAKAAIDAVRRRNPLQDVIVVHNDQLTNNFNGLLQTVLRSETSYMREDHYGPAGHTFVYASPGSFYETVAPAGTVQLGVSTCALHWMSRVPKGIIRDHIYQGGATEDEKKQLAEVARVDWINFLRSRAAELAPGARLVVNMLGRRFESQEIECRHSTLNRHSVGNHRYVRSVDKSGKDSITVQTLLDLMNDILKELVAEGALTEYQFRDLIIPIYCRTLNEVLEPIESLDSPLADQFKVEHACIKDVPLPIEEEYMRGGKNAHQRFAHDITCFVRAWSELTLLNAFTGGDRDQNEEYRSVVDELFKRFEARIAADPDKYAHVENHLIYLVLVRKPSF